MSGNQVEKFSDMNDLAWKEMLNRDMRVCCQGMHYLEVARRADELGVSDPVIEMLREPERTRAQRIKRGEFPYSGEEIKAMPPVLRRMIVVCHNAWVDGKGSENGIASYATRKATAELQRGLADESGGSWWGK